MTTTLPARQHPRSQRGAALIVSMVMLVAITLIGVFVMSNSRLEWLMANNSQLQSDAYRNAAIALQAGINTIIPATPWVIPPAISPLTPAQLSAVANWTNGNGTLAPTPVGTGAFIVQYLGCREVINAPPNLALVPPPTCNTPGNVSIHTYRAWAYGADGKGATRLLTTDYALFFPVGSTLPTVGPGPANWTELP